MNPGPSRTHHANQAVAIKELLALRFAEERFGDAAPRALKVSEPDGPSTDGGRKARQSLVLADTDGATSLVCGWIDVAKRVAEVRAFAVVNQQHQARHHRPLDIPREDYNRFAGELSSFLETQGIETHQRKAPPRQASSIPRPARATPISGDTLFVAAAFGVLIGFALAFIVFGLPNLL